MKSDGQAANPKPRQAKWAESEGGRSRVLGRGQQPRRRWAEAAAAGGPGRVEAARLARACGGAGRGPLRVSRARPRSGGAAIFYFCFNSF